MDTTSLRALTDRAVALAHPERRTILGIVGPPGSGKTSLATKLAKRVTAAGAEAAHVPMDGFHLADVSLVERGLLDAKGAIETFDAYGYLALLQRLRVEVNHEVLAPSFERGHEQPIAAAITVRPSAQLIVTEGNYLLDETEPWPQVRAEMDQVWFVDLDRDRRRSRLIERHVSFGKDRASAQVWVDDVDEPNARRVIARQGFADLVVRLT